MRGRSGLLRGGMEGVRGDYRVLRSSRLRASIPNLPYTGAGADWEFLCEADYYKAVALARYVDQNDPLVGQAIDRLVNLVFKTGMKYDAATGNPAADAVIKKAWTQWSTDPRRCDARGRSTLADLGKLVFRATVVDGDHVVLPLANRRLQCVEGHRMKTPQNSRDRKTRVVLGVLSDALGRATEYWLTKEDKGPLAAIKLVGEVEKYPAYDRDGNPLALHVFNPARVSQTRGVSACVRLIENAMAHADLQFAMLIKEQAAACVTILRNKEVAAAGVPMSGAAAFGPTETIPNRDGTSTMVHELRPGLEIEGRPGETISMNAPNLPGDGFLKHSVQVLTFISVNLGIPVQVLLLDPTQSNFSSWRGAMDIAQHGFAAIREWMVTQFFTPVYLWWLRGEIAENPEIAAIYEEIGEDIFGHQFTPPYDPYIEPSKDVTAEEKQIASRLDSRRNVLARRGLDLDDVDLDIVTDQVALLKLCLEGAAQLLKEFPDSGITWRDVYQVGMVQGSPPAVSPESGDRSLEEEEEEEDGTTESTKNTKKGNG